MNYTALVAPLRAFSRHAVPDSAPDLILLDPPADALPLTEDAAAAHVKRVQRWLEDAVIGLNLSLIHI